MEKVTIISNSNSRIGITIPDLRFSRQWPAKNSKVVVDKEIFEQIMFDNGVRYMFESGMLYTSELQPMKDVGLEPEDAEERVNIIILTDAQRKRYLTVLPLHEFKQKVRELGYEELHNLADYAIENRLVDLDKCEVIKEIIGKDIIRAIQLEKLDKEG